MSAFHICNQLLKKQMEQDTQNRQDFWDLDDAYFSVTEKTLYVPSSGSNHKISHITAAKEKQFANFQVTGCQASTCQLMLAPESTYTIQNVLITWFEIHTPPWKGYKCLSRHTTAGLLFVTQLWRWCISMDAFVQNLCIGYWFILFCC